MARRTILSKTAASEKPPAPATCVSRPPAHPIQLGISMSACVPDVPQGVVHAPEGVAATAAAAKKLLPISPHIHTCCNWVDAGGCSHQLWAHEQRIMHVAAAEFQQQHRIGLLCKPLLAAVLPAAQCERWAAHLMIQP